MKFLFLSILLINIVFFFWEQRKGAPEIYFSIDTESNADHEKQKQIFLFSELPPKVALLEIDSVSDDQTIVSEENYQELSVDPLNNTEPENMSETGQNRKSTPPLPIEREFVDSSNKKITEITKQEAKLAEPEAVVFSEPKPANTEVQTETFFACYPLQEGEYSEQMFVTTNKSAIFKFKLVRQEQQYISSYFVLTLAANSYQEAKTWETTIKQQGINDLWLITDGVFKWRISLGVFSTQSNAEKAKASFLTYGVKELEVMPNYKTKAVTEVKVSGQKDDISLFNDEFLRYFKQESQCIKVQE
ncbi:MAG: hypothetical protein K9L22_02350 [Methylococcaceae bacterium]|nr:hypothetical protein [Methylococcaceae bacterium]